MAYSFWDVIADIFTGGAYSATKAVTNAATIVAGEALNAIGAVAPQAGQPNVGVGPQIGQSINGVIPLPGYLPGQIIQGVGLVPASVAGTPTSIRETKCCGYVIDGDYLLNSETGQVWLIDKQNKELLPFRRNMLPLESAASTLNLDLMKKLMQQQKETEIGKLHHSERGDFSKKVDTLINVIDSEISISMKASKIQH